MPSVYDLKPKFQTLLRPGVRSMADTGVTASQVTVLAALLSVAYGVLLFYYPNRWVLLGLPVLLFFRMALNAVDGMLAREFNQKSKLGAFLNELGDVVSDTALYLPLGLLPGVSFGLAFTFAFLAILSEFTGVLALMVGSERRYEGPMGKSDRAALIGIGSFLLGIHLVPLWVLNGFIAVGILLLPLTIVRRIQRALHPL
jgi:CDP-diacylglycerol--glycerol-3-phosphate 3-phosphatidyltransferase